MSEWQPIETAPKDGKDVQVYVTESREQFVAFWSESDDGFCFATTKEGKPILVKTPTHWMPLPPPPTKD